MNTKNLLVAATITAAIMQAVNAIPLATISSGNVTSEVQYKAAPGVSPTLIASDADLLVPASTSGSTSINGVGLAALSQAQTEWSFTSDDFSAQYRIDSSLRLHDVSIFVENRSVLYLNVAQDAIFSVSGNLDWNPNDFFVEALSEHARLRPNGPGFPYIYFEQDFRRSNFDPSNTQLTLNQINESPSLNGELTPSEPGYNVSPAVDPASYLLTAGLYEIQWNNKLWEGSVKGLGTPDDSDFLATGFFQFNLEALPDGRVPETSATVMLLGAGMVGLALAGRRFGQQNA